jgi:hypothetical protein
MTSNTQLPGHRSYRHDCRHGDVDGHDLVDRPPRPHDAATFTDGEGHFWLEQNPAKASKWAKFAREGHDIAW